MEQIRGDITTLWLAIFVLAFFLWRTRKRMAHLIETLEEVILEQEKKIAERRVEEHRRGAS